METERRYFYRARGEDGWLDVIATRGFFPEVLKTRRDLDTVRFVVYTTVGKNFEVAPEATLLDKIWREQERFLERSSAVA
jgi:hypothetical protein